MAVWLGIIGVAVLIFTLYDIFHTTMSSSRSGMLTISTLKLFRWVKKFLILKPGRKVWRRYRKLYHYIVAFFGLLTLVWITSFWDILLWTGWTLIFRSVCPFEFSLFFSGTNID